MPALQLGPKNGNASRSARRNSLQNNCITRVMRVKLEISQWEEGPKPAALKRSCEETHCVLNKGASARVFVDRFGRSRWVLSFRSFQSAAAASFFKRVQCCLTGAPHACRERGRAEATPLHWRDQRGNALRFSFSLVRCRRLLWRLLIRGRRRLLCRREISGQIFPVW